jgi:uncharacterized membrane protein YbhN (UPF0104 family)
MKKKTSKRFQWILGGFGLAGSVSCLIHFGNWKDLTMPPLQVLLILSLLIGAEMLCRAERLRRIGLVLGKKISLGDGLWVNAIGEFFSRVTPASLGGELSRFAVLTRMDLKMSGSATIILAEGIVNRISLGIFMMLLLLFFLVKGFGSISASFVFYSMLLYLVMALGYVVLLIGLKRYKKIDVDWRHFLVRFDLLGLTLAHHLIRLGFLPLIVSFLVPDAPLVRLFVWSFILIEGLSLLPIPSGGGSVEIAFIAALEPFLGAEITLTSLVWWRLVTHYSYILIGGGAVLLGTLGLVGKEPAGEKSEPIAEPDFG